MDPFSANNLIATVQSAFAAGDGEVANKRLEAANVERLQEIYRAISRDDFAALGELVSDDVELEIIGPDGAPFVGKWRGRGEVVQAVERNFAQIDDQQPLIDSLTAQGDSVVVFGRERTRWRATGRQFETRWAMQFTFRDGRAARIVELCDNEPLVRAAMA